MKPWMWWALVSVACGIAGWGIGVRRVPQVRTEIKEVIRWQEKIGRVAQASVEKETNQQVKVVTRWLRSDGTLSKERTTETGTNSVTSSSKTLETSKSASLASDRASKSVTNASQPRWHINGLLGLDLKAGLSRRWGAQVQYRIAGPVWIGGYVQQPGVVGASVGFAF